MRSLKNLEILFLNDTEITDVGLMHLRELSNLDVLQIDGTKVTQRGIAQLRKSLSETSIYSRYE
ncbi:MAG: hypothetical protein ACYTG0_44545 [Planctomycetota bacterium]